jgi:hypothetical protein
VYRVEYSRHARAQVDSLGPVGRRALADALVQLRGDPSVGQRAPGYPPEFHTVAFGAWGLVFYLVWERRGAIVVLDVIWAGA